MIIIGGGLIAKAFKNRIDKKVLIFASGVSNSNETNKVFLDKEKNLLISTIKNYPNHRLIYFSSILILKKIKNPYYQHKLEMESIIKKSKIKYLILRLPQIIGKGGNQNNLVNFFVNNIINSNKIFIEKNTYRALIDIDDLVKLVIFLINKKNKIVNLSHIELIKVEHIVKIIGDTLNLKPNIVFIKKGVSIPNKNSKIVGTFIKEKNINKKNYNLKILKKYFDDRY